MAEEARSTAEAYHRLTKYNEETLPRGPGLDWSRQPEQFKDIVSSHRVSLRQYLPFQEQGGSTDTRRGIGIGRIGRLLFYSNGVTGVIRYQNGGSQLLRASPSAGALYPTEIYVALRELRDVEAGLYNYQVRTHELVRLWEGDQMQAIQEACGGHEVFESAQACVLLTGIHWRSAWRYQERGYRRVLLDTGHVASNMVAYAPHEGCTAYPIHGFCDSALNGLFFFDDVKEAALMAVPLLDAETSPPPPSLWSSRDAGPVELSAASILDEEDLRDSATLALHRASCCGEAAPVDAANTPDAPRAAAIPLAEPGPLTENVPDAIVQRRSARGYTGEPMSLSELGRAIGYAFGRDGSARYATRDAGMLDAHLIAHDVKDLDPGIYRIEGHGEALAPVETGDQRDRLFHIALDQEIARACAAILAFSAPAAKSIELWGNRAYRHLHVEAGMLGERFQLGAGALGLGACGIGGFLDDEAAAALGREDDDFVLYLVTVGHV